MLYCVLYVLAMIYILRKAFHFTVKNPCLTIKTYHYHCENIRSSDHMDTVRRYGFAERHIVYAEPEYL